MRNFVQMSHKESENILRTFILQELLFNFGLIASFQECNVTLQMLNAMPTRCFLHRMA